MKSASISSYTPVLPPVLEGPTDLENTVNQMQGCDRDLIIYGNFNSHTIARSALPLSGPDASASVGVRLAIAGGLGAEPGFFDPSSLSVKSERSGKNFEHSIF